MIVKFISLFHIRKQYTWNAAQRIPDYGLQLRPATLVLNDSICGAIVWTTLNKTIKLQFIRGHLIEWKTFFTLRACTSNELSVSYMMIAFCIEYLRENVNFLRIITVRSIHSENNSVQFIHLHKQIVARKKNWDLTTSVAGTSIFSSLSIHRECKARDSNANCYWREKILNTLEAFDDSCPSHALTQYAYNISPDK